MNDGNADLVPGTQCPFGTSAIVLPKMGLRGTEIQVQTVTPACSRKCMFYADGCLILAGLKKLVEIK